MLDLFCGRWGWSRAFAARGWECVGVDLIEPLEIPARCEFMRVDVLKILRICSVSAVPPIGGIGATKSSGRMDSAVVDSSPSAKANDFRTPAPIAHVVGQGGRCWCGEIHEHYIAPNVLIHGFNFIVASPPCVEFSVHGMKHFHPNPKYPVMGMRLFNHTRHLCEGSGLPYVIENVRAAQQFVGSAAHHCGPFYLWGSGVPPMMPQGINKGTTGQMGFDAAGKRLVEGPRKYSHGSERRADEVAKRATIPPELASCVAEYAERICEASTTQAK